MPKPPDFPHEAWNTLVHEVYKPVFLEKLAEYNIVPRSQEEEVSLMEVAGLLRNANATGRVKQASAITDGADALKKLFAREGVAELPTSKDRLVKSAAAHVITNPRILEAAAVFGNFLAHQ